MTDNTSFTKPIRDTPGPISQTLEVPTGMEVATFGGGCFWGIEHIFRKYFTNKGLLDARVGYTGGNNASPSYKEVKSSTTNHAEVVQILFDPSQVSFETLTDFFFRIHDPTTLNKQGDEDIGTQYRSVIFIHGDKQMRTALDTKARMQTEFYPNNTIVTLIEPIKIFWDAETYHQLYLDKNPMADTCPTHFLRTTPKK
ncbi:methionine sulfoxide reductase A [Nadsonia fulvescens var. elongata DSM 6958]|uniref:peptide-methionine (S)-S-oxide reductase n=1 Tax=Nadsonia fulvescens var. elongata DSM 6958 TaxID=857566 RepID=A0A1E3PK07_9ASCO|nr:methionine sulfoxide reductase A [Nadsonia fulvescens var. elongata DSM 6958]